MARNGHGGGWLLVAAVLSACTGPAVDKPARADLSGELVHLKGDGPPKGPEGACWDKDTTPAVIETVTEQVLVSPEARDAAGQITAPATFRSKTAQHMVQDRQEVWFRAPCPAQMDVAFLASLQRALKARGLYDAPISGLYDDATAEAVRRFQAERGLDSPRLSLAAAKELGLIAVDIDRL
jgi:hypothetical protein